MHPLNLYGPSHVAALLVTLLLWILLLRMERRGHPWSRRAEVALAVALLSQWVVRNALALWLGYFDPHSALPLHLCDVAAFLGGAALLTRRQWCIDLTFFWGLAGTLQGLLTPILMFDFPHPEYFGFFLLHSGVVLTALHVTVAWRRLPSLAGMWRAFGWIQVYALIAAAVNAAMGSNYAFLGARPTQPSLMDLLPDPPLHVLVLEPIALGLFWLSYFLLRLSQRKVG